MPASKRQRDSEHASKQPHGKRRKPGAEDAAAEADPAAQEASVKAYMFHAVKLLNKALKKSRTFEVQKLARKLKSSGELKEGAVDAALVADLEAQLAALKALTLDPIPLHLLSARLPKFAYLHPILASILASLPAYTPPSATELDPKTVEGKARNRTLANKLVKEAWDEIARAVGKRMGQEVEARPVKLAVPAPSSVKGKEIAVEKARQEEEGEEGDKPVKKLSKRAERAAKGAAKALLPKPAIMMNSARMAAMAAGSDDDEGSDDEGPVSGSDMDDDHEIQKELARLGGDDAGDWSGSSDEEGVQSDADDDDNLGSNSSLPLVAAKPAKSTAKPKTKDSAPRKPITSSAFLPSLASGYISYSDSDGEDAKWVKEAEKGEKKEERKNRRGQRARQAIWEKKYGSGANHIVKTTGAPAAPQKGGKASKREKKTGHSDISTPYDPSKAPGAAFNANAQPVAERKVTRPIISYNTKVVPVVAARVPEKVAAVPSRVEAGMHPSWEAKRKAAEALQTLASAPKGKKITFD